MSVLCVVQARAGSSRLPGKVLMDLDGQPMLAFMLQRLTALRDVEVVVATSVEPADDAVVACAAGLGYGVVRGDEADVLSRFELALDRHPADHVIRLTADCPLIDAHLVGQVVADHLETGADYTSNTLIRTHPDGLDVEVVRSSALLEASEQAQDPAEREHVTPFVYRRPGRFRLGALVGEERWGHLRWTVDTLDDIERVRGMVVAGQVHDSWQATLADLPPEQRLRLRDGFEPARAGEVPADAGPLDDPGRRIVVLRVDGAPVGWLRLTVDSGVAAVDGDIPPEHRTAAREHLAELNRTTLQITDHGALP